MDINVLLENLVSVDLTEEEVIALETAFDILESKMPFLLKLKRDEVESLVRLHKGNEQFCKDAVREAKQFKWGMPKSLDPNLLQRKLDFATRFERVVAKATQLGDGIYVTDVRDGAEAVSMANKMRDFFLHRAGLGEEDAKDAAAAYERLSQDFIDRAAKAQKTMAANQLRKTLNKGDDKS